MPTLTTRIDATQFVTTSIEGSGAVETASDEYFVDQIVDALYAEAGSWDVESVDTDSFWALVQKFDRTILADHAAAHLDAFVGDGVHVAEWQGRVLEITAPDGSTLALAYDPTADSPGYSWSEYTDRDSFNHRFEITSGTLTGVTQSTLRPVVDEFLARHAHTEAGTR